MIVLLRDCLDKSNMLVKHFLIYLKVIEISFSTKEKFLCDLCQRYLFHFLKCIILIKSNFSIFPLIFKEFNAMSVLLELYLPLLCCIFLNVKLGLKFVCLLISMKSKKCSLVLKRMEI